MKILSLLTLLLMAGCHTATLPAPTLPSPQAPADIHPVSAPPAPTMLPAPPPIGAIEKQLTFQAQLIEALMSQNDALTARLSAAPVPSAEEDKPKTEPPTPLPEPKRATALSVPPLMITPPAETATLVTPNADGLFDLTVMDATGADSANPFAVRRLASESMREVTLRVTGMITGKTPSVLINDRLMQAGDVVETLSVERIESDAVVLRHQSQLLKLPIAGKPARVRLSL